MSTSHAFFGKASHNKQDNEWLLFDTEECEECGKLCLAPNSITAYETEDRLLFFGYVYEDVPESEWLLWADEVGGDGRCYCYNCYHERDMPENQYQICGFIENDIVPIDTERYECAVQTAKTEGDAVEAFLKASTGWEMLEFLGYDPEHLQDVPFVTQMIP